MYAVIKLVPNGVVLKAAVCPVCGARIYPVRDLKSHQLRHIIIYDLPSAHPDQPRTKDRDDYAWGYTGL